MDQELAAIALRIGVVSAIAALMIYGHFLKAWRARENLLVVAHQPQQPMRYSEPLTLLFASAILGSIVGVGLYTVAFHVSV